MKRLVTIALALAILTPLTAKPVREAAQGKVSYLDLDAKSNRKLADNQGSGVEGNTLTELKVGEQIFGGVQFKVGEGLLQLGSKGFEDLPAKIEGIAVNRPFAKLHLLHATCFGGGPNKPGDGLFVEDGTLIGEYRVNFEDRSAVVFPIVYGQDVRDWFYVDGEREPSRGKVAWKGDNVRAKQVGARIRVYRSTWENPWPGKKATTIDYSSRKEDTVAAPFCLAITVEDK